MKQYTVLQQHFGDKQYWPGDTRAVHDADAPELLAMGLISQDEQQPAEQKAQTAAPKNKAVGAAAKNKAVDDAEAGND